MTALPQHRPTETQQHALQSWIRKTGTTALFLTTGSVSILLAVIFGTDIWRIALAGILLLMLIACIAVIIVSVQSVIRDDS